MKQIKLGKAALSFYDPISGISLAPGEVKDFPGGKMSWVMKEAIRGKHVIVFDEEPEQTLEGTGAQEPPIINPEPATVDPEKKAKLMAMKVKNILDEFKWMEDEDLATAKALKTKEELVDFLLTTELAYDTNE